jgi:hypothetical protein
MVTFAPTAPSGPSGVLGYLHPAWADALTLSTYQGQPGASGVNLLVAGVAGQILRKPPGSDPGKGASSLPHPSWGNRLHDGLRPVLRRRGYQKCKSSCQGAGAGQE